MISTWTSCEKLYFEKRKWATMIWCIRWWATMRWPVSRKTRQRAWKWAWKWIWQGWNIHFTLTPVWLYLSTCGGQLLAVKLCWLVLDCSFLASFMKWTSLASWSFCSFTLPQCIIWLVLVSRRWFFRVVKSNFKSAATKTISSWVIKKWTNTCFKAFTHFCMLYSLYWACLSWVLHCFQIFFYCNHWKMLVVMTFNVQYFASLTVGVAVAHFTWNLSNCDAQYASRKGNDGETFSENNRCVMTCLAGGPKRDYRKESIINHDCCSWTWLLLYIIYSICGASLIFL